MSIKVKSSLSKTCFHRVVIIWLFQWYPGPICLNLVYSAAQYARYAGCVGAPPPPSCHSAYNLDEWVEPSLWSRKREERPVWDFSLQVGSQQVTVTLSVSVSPTSPDSASLGLSGSWQIRITNELNLMPASVYIYWLIILFIHLFGCCLTNTVYFFIHFY